jgi:hypothetical protein
MQKAACAPENSSGKPTKIRKSSRIIPAPNAEWTHGKKSTMTEKGSQKKNSDAAFGKIFRNSKFPQKGSLKNSKPTAHVQTPPPPQKKNRETVKRMGVEGADRKM